MGYFGACGWISYPSILDVIDVEFRITQRSPRDSVDGLLERPAIRALWRVHRDADYTDFRSSFHHAALTF